MLTKIDITKLNAAIRELLPADPDEAIPALVTILAQLASEADVEGWRVVDLVAWMVDGGKETRKAIQ